MSPHKYTALSWLSLDDLEDLAEAVRIANARDERVTQDSCQRCGSQGCEQCRPDLGRRSRR